MIASPKGASIRIFLVDGTPQGLRVVDQSGWTGTCLAFARADYAAARLRPEVRRTGVYVLVGPEAGGHRPVRVYVGEGDEVRSRLDSHHQSKDFWTHGYVLTTKDDSLNKAHVRYLEARLIALATAADAAVRDNGTAPPPLPLGEAEETDLERYLQKALTMLPLVGVTLFDVVDVPAPAATGSMVASPLTGRTYTLKADLSSATGRDDARGFTVIEGSLGRQVEKVMGPGYKALRARLLQEGVLVPEGEAHVRLTRTFVFDSPSAAASVMSGGSKNGRDAWQDSAGVTLGQHQAHVAQAGT